MTAAGQSRFVYNIYLHKTVGNLANFKVDDGRDF